MLEHGLRQDYCNRKYRCRMEIELADEKMEKYWGNSVLYPH